MNTEIEIIGISTCGTYPSWLAHTIASFYNHVDKIIVVNSGYNINKPENEAIYPLEREQKQLRELDIDNKIIEIIPTKKHVNNIFQTTCKRGKDELGRSTNMTLATQLASSLPSIYNEENINNNKQKNTERWILKLDSDQILYKITRLELEITIKIFPNKTGFRFAQYADYYHDIEHISSGLPDEFTNDGALLYKSLSNKIQGYCGQGSPGYIQTDQYPIYSIKTSHMRRINSPNVEPYEYHFKRLWYHTYAPNSINEHDYNHKTGKKLTNEEILEMAHKQTISILKEKGRKISELPYDQRIPYEPPLVCKMSPLTYIKEGY